MIDNGHKHRTRGERGDRIALRIDSAKTAQERDPVPTPDSPDVRVSFREPTDEDWRG